MPLTREERKLLHHKSKQPTFGAGEPKSKEGYDGDITFRKVQGSGTVEYVKEKGAWKAVASSGEMPAVKIYGGGGSSSTGGGVTNHGGLSGLSNDDHNIYVLADGARELTADWDAGSFDITAEQFHSDIAIGTSPFTVISTTEVTNLNAAALSGADWDAPLAIGNTTANTGDFTTLTSSGDTTLGDADADASIIRGTVTISDSSKITNIKGTLNVDEAVTLDTSLDVTGDTSVTTFDSTGITSLATAGGIVNIASTGIMTTVKGTLNVDGAVTFDSTLGVTGATTLSETLTVVADKTSQLGGDVTVKSSIDIIAAGALELGKATATSVNIADSGVMTTVEGTFNVDEAVTLDNNLGVDGDLDVDGKTTLDQTTINVTDGDFKVEGSTNSMDIDVAVDFDSVVNMDQVIIDTADGAFSVDGANGTTINSTSAAIGIGNDADAFAIDIGTGASARTITIGNDLSTKVDIDALIIELDSAGTIILDSTTTTSISSTTTTDIQATTNLTLDSSGGNIGIGTDGDTGAINIGTNAGARTITVGNAASTAVNLDALAIALTSVNALNLSDGTATFQLGGSGATSLSGGTTTDIDGSGALSLNSTAGDINIGDDDDDFNINIGTQGERTISVGTGAFAQTIGIGNATGATAVTIAAGTGDLALTSADVMSLTPTGVFNLTGGSSVYIDATNALALESSASQIYIGSDAVAQKIRIGGETSVRTEVELNAILIDINAGATGCKINSTGVMYLDSDTTSHFRMAANSAGNKTFAIGATNAGAGTGTLDIDADGEIDIFSEGNMFIETEGSLDIVTAKNLAIKMEANLASTKTLKIKASNAGAGVGKLDLDADGDIDITSLGTIDMDSIGGTWDGTTLNFEFTEYIGLQMVGADAADLSFDITSENAGAGMGLFTAEADTITFSTPNVATSDELQRGLLGSTNWNNLSIYSDATDTWITSDSNHLKLYAAGDMHLMADGNEIKFMNTATELVYEFNMDASPTLTVHGVNVNGGTFRIINEGSSGDIKFRPEGGNVNLESASGTNTFNFYTNDAKLVISNANDNTKDPKISFTDSDSGDDWAIGMDISETNTDPKFKINSSLNIANPGDFELDKDGNGQFLGDLLIQGNDLTFGNTQHLDANIVNRLEISQVLYGVHIHSPYTVLDSTGAPTSILNDAWKLKWQLSGSQGQHIAGGTAEYENNYCIVGLHILQNDIAGDCFLPYFDPYEENPS